MNALKMSRCPRHPGRILKNHLEGINYTITAFAKHIGVSRKTLSLIINEKQKVTPIMALRLSKALNTTPDLWVNLQTHYDLWHAKQKKDWQKIQKMR